jgi:hypothetical protein
MPPLDNLKNRAEKLNSLLLLSVGIHSILLGCLIYFFTDFFCRIFFSGHMENIFFIRQAGVFLFLMGIFYLYPLADLKNSYNFILLAAFSKVTAVYFLLANAKFAPSPKMIYLTAFFDFLMAVVFIFVYQNCRKEFAANKDKTIFLK